MLFIQLSSILVSVYGPFQSDTFRHLAPTNHSIHFDLKSPVQQAVTIMAMIWFTTPHCHLVVCIIEGKCQRVLPSVSVLTVYGLSLSASPSHAWQILNMERSIYRNQYGGQLQSIAFVIKSSSYTKIVYLNSYTYVQWF